MNDQFHNTYSSTIPTRKPSSKRRTFSVDWNRHLSKPNPLGYKPVSNESCQTDDISMRTQPDGYRSHSHRRAPSDSAALTPMRYGVTYRPLPSAEVYEFCHDDESSTRFSKHLPTPSHTPSHENFFTSHYLNHPHNQFSPDSAMAAHLAMEQAFFDQQSTFAEDDSPGFTHSSRQSISSYGQSPATPRTVYGEDAMEEKANITCSNGENHTSMVESLGNWLGAYLPYEDSEDSSLRQTFPKLDRTMSDIYQDELYNPLNVPQTATHPHSRSHSSSTNHLSPYRSIVTERLQAANEARSHSPATSAARDLSPFRPGSPLAPVSNTFSLPPARLESTVSNPHTQNLQSDVLPIRQQNEDVRRNTISPRDAVLDYHEPVEDSQVSLFPEVNTTQQAYIAPPYEMKNQNTVWSSDAPLEPDLSQTSNTIQGEVELNLIVPPVNNVIHSLELPAQQYHPTTATSMLPISVPAPVPIDTSPDFPAHLTSMETSISDPDGLDTASSQCSSTADAATKPSTSSLANTGTYMCTYPGCPNRFDSPTKLHKHKRDCHPRSSYQNPQQMQPSPSQTSATTSAGDGTDESGGHGEGEMLTGRRMSAASLASRNSQPGPHRCTRVNPQTGKLCHTIFSRPYDLTRHEDTIHNARKQKVRCFYCKEDKLFSRNDALTRHMRVVHPDIEFFGGSKQRKKGL